MANSNSMDDNQAELVGETTIDNPFGMAAAGEVDVGDSQTEEPQEEPQEDPQEDPQEEPQQKEPQEEPQQDSQEDPEEEIDLEDYSEGALLAMSWKEEGELPEDFEIPKDASVADMKQKVKDYWRDEIAEQKDLEYKQKGFTEDMQRYIEFLQQGGDPQELQETAFNKKDYESIELQDGEEESVRTNRRDVIMEMYSDMGLPEERAKMLYEKLYDDGEDLQEAQKAVDYLSQKQDEREEQVLERQKQQYEEYQRKMQEQQEEAWRKQEEIIDSGEFAGIKIEDDKKEQFKKALTEPTEIVQVQDEDGNIVKRKVTPYKKKELEFGQNLEQQLAFAYHLVFNDMNFKPIQAEGKRAASDQFMETLERKSGRRQVKRGNNKTSRKSTRSEEGSELVSEFDL